MVNLDISSSNIGYIAEPDNPAEYAVHYYTDQAGTAFKFLLSTLPKINQDEPEVSEAGAHNAFIQDTSSLFHAVHHRAGTSWRNRPDPLPRAQFIS